jgi:hypothetical protein
VPARGNARREENDFLIRVKKNIKNFCAYFCTPILKNFPSVLQKQEFAEKPFSFVRIFSKPLVSLCLTPSSFRSLCI